LSSYTYSKRILVVRHGRTEWNDAHRFQGKTDVPLNETGLLQAGRTAQRIASWPLDAVYTSPLTRAHRTASAIAAPHGKEPIVLDDLAEVDFGEWESRRIEDIRKETGDLLRAWYKDPFFHMPRGSETWDAFLSRIERAVRAVLGSPHRNVAVISHGGVVRALYVVLLGLDPHTVWNLRMSNCALSGIEVREHETSLVFSNDELHLRETGLPENVNLPVW
jgi:alpha-ribazole phosphatase/probable phosphoglycerate mutase